MQVRIGRRGLIGLAAIAVLAVAGGIAYAAIPGSNGVISGCYSKKRGELRVIDTDAGARCSASEKPIGWNQQGPQGTPGPSNAYFHQDALGVGVVVNPGDGWRVMASLNVPAGSYVVTAKTTVDVVNFVSRSRIDCAILADSSTIDAAAVTVPGDHQSVEVLSTGVQLASPGTIVFRCIADPTKGMATLYSSSLTAIKVSDLESQ